MAKRISEIIMKLRLLILILIFGITAIGIYTISGLDIYTDFSDLLSKRDPYVEVYKAYRDTIGGANLLLTSVKVKEGDIFNKNTLEKIRYISKEMVKLKGVDRYKVLSIAEKKAKDIKADAWGIRSVPIMWPYVPENDEEIRKLKETIFANDAFYGALVSLDCKEALIIADFFEENVDYNKLFRNLRRIRETVEDENTVVSITGHPIHIGYVQSHIRDILYILGVTLVVIILIFYFYFRTKRGMILPLVSGFISAIWGLSIMKLMGFHLDPLILVIPFLVSSRASGHSAQIMKRFMEQIEEVKDVKVAAQKSIEYLLSPGLCSIITDAAGVVLIGIASIPLLDSIAMPCSLWFCATIINSLILTPILLSYIPARETFLNNQDRRDSGILDKLLSKLGYWIVDKGKWYTIVISVAIIIFTSFYFPKVKTGDIQPGSFILWPDSRYNIDAERISRDFPGAQYPLYIIFEGNVTDILKTSKFILSDVEKFQKYVFEHNPHVVGTESIVDFLKKVYMKYHEDDPKWQFIPRGFTQVGNFFYLTIASGDPGDFEKYVFKDDSSCNIIFYLSDKRGETIKSVINTIEYYINNKTKVPPEEGKYRLAGGVVGMELSINNAVNKALSRNLTLSFLVVFFFCLIFYRSLIAGGILVIHLIIANFITITYMVLKDIGFTVNTFPVISVALGIGVDYGIYYVSRLKDEWKLNRKNLDKVIVESMVTTGKANTFIATTMVGGIIFWSFSALRFQAEMGYLIALLLTIDLIGSLTLIPALISIIKPKFIEK